MPDEQERHTELLSNSVWEAIVRDFGETHPSIRTLRVSIPALEKLINDHLRGCIIYQDELGNGLAEANREGEDARQQERLRIWGYS